MPQQLSSTLDVPRELAADGNLTSVDVYVTSQCNRRCTYCFLPAEFFASGTRMSMESFSGVVSWSQRNGVMEMTLLGGEPSLHPAFVDMANLATNRQLDVRVVTNGARRFRRLLAEGAIGPHNLARVAVSLDTVDETIQDKLRGPRAWQDAQATISLLREKDVPFDVNVTAVRSVLDGMDALIDFADEAGCRRVNIHWPSTIGLGAGLVASEIPQRSEWAALVQRIGARIERRPGFFVEIERGYLADGQQLTECALTELSNLQILPDGRAYRCGLLVDQVAMSSISMTGDRLAVVRPDRGEELLRTSMSRSCTGCPAKPGDELRACIYDKISSLRPHRG